jgi:nicotinamide/nicotinate riboside kinase
VQDWDAAPGAIDWPLFTSFLRSLKTTGILPDHSSHDHLNEHKDIPVAKELEEKWVSRLAELSAREKGVKVLWGLVDGFLLYWHQVSLTSL